MKTITHEVLYETLMNLNRGRITVSDAHNIILGLIDTIEKCHKCGGKNWCEWCNPFDKPVPPEGIKL